MDVTVVRRVRYAGVTASAAMLVFGAIACSDDEPVDTAGDTSTIETTSSTEVDDSSPDTATDDTATDDTATLPAGDLDAERAIEVALAATPGAVVDLSQDDEQGQRVWEVTVRQPDGSAIEHYVAVATGEVLKSEPADVPAAAATPPAVTALEAIRAAEAAVTGGTAIEADLEMSAGRVVWEVYLRTSGPNYEVYVDASTGSVISTEVAD